MFATARTVHLDRLTMGLGLSSPEFRSSHGDTDDGQGRSGLEDASLLLVELGAVLSCPVTSDAR
jgi:hypothetical protein